jgi:hypothetical protein
MAKKKIPLFESKTFSVRKEKHIPNKKTKYIKEFD